jgi:hypothetical protein
MKQPSVVSTENPSIPERRHNASEIVGIAQFRTKDDKSAVASSFTTPVESDMLNDNKYNNDEMAQTELKQPEEFKPELQQQNKENTNLYYWIVKIPIKKQNEIVPFGKYEKAEALYNKKIKIKTVSKKEWYEMWSGAYIGLLCGVENEDEEEYNMYVNIEGSIMAKYNKIIKA